MRLLERGFRWVGLLVLLAACNGGGGGNPPGGGSLSGTVTAPSGGNVQNTLVAACFVENNRCNLNSPNTKIGRINSSGSGASFSFSGLAAGGYGLIAQKDVNGTGSLDNGDYEGCYGNAQGCLIVRPPQSGLSIQLSVVGGGGGGQTGSLSGTLIFPGAPPTPTALDIDPTIRNHLNAGRPVEVVAGEVIVRFKPSVSVQNVTRLSVGGVELAQVRLLASGKLTLYRAEGLDQGQTLGLVERLGQQANVEEAFPNWVLYSYKTPNDSFYGAQWHYPLMNLPTAWDITDGTSPAVTVAVVDSGIIPHPDLQGKLLPGYDFISNLQVAGDGNGRDSNPNDEGGESGYHGTHVAGTVGAATNNGAGVAGVSWGARVLPLRALGITGGGSFADILDAVSWAAGGSVSGVPANPNPAKVINLSLGGGGQACPSSVSQLFQSLANQGVMVVAAAGNENANVSTSVPANCDGVITVGAVGPQGRRAPYSNYGALIDVMAPGGDTSQTFTFQGQTYPAGVLSTLRNASGTYNYVFYQGTSMASPHVAGLVALMLAKEPGLSFQTVLTRLRDASRALSASECNRPSGSDCGAGLVDAAKALSGSGGGTPPPPPPPPPTGQLTTYVVGFYCTNTVDCFPYDELRTAVAVVQATASRVPYSLANLEAGPYLVAAWQDVNGNELVDNGEPFGFAKNTDGSPKIVSLQAGQQLSGLIVRMEPAVTSSMVQGLRVPLTGQLEKRLKSTPFSGISLFR